MGKIVYNVAARVGEYTDNQGNQKSRWSRCGVIIQNDKGHMSLKLESLPVGMASEDGSAGLWFSLFPPENESKGKGGRQGQRDSFGNSVPQGQMPPPSMPSGGSQPSPQQAKRESFQDPDIPF